MAWFCEGGHEVRNDRFKFCPDCGKPPKSGAKVATPPTATPATVPTAATPKSELIECKCGMLFTDVTEFVKHNNATHVKAEAPAPTVTAAEHPTPKKEPGILEELSGIGESVLGIFGIGKKKQSGDKKKD